MKTPGRWKWRWGLALVCCWRLAAAASGQQHTAPEIVAAKVAGQAITVGDVTAALEATPGYRALSGSTRKQAEAQALEQLINRRLVMLYLDRAKIVATREELAAAQKALAAMPPGGSSNGEAPVTAAASEDRQLSDRLKWQICWSKFLGQQLTDKRLQAYFEAHRRDYDGTEVRASHILLKGDAVADPQLRTQLTKQAAELRQKIIDGKLTFAVAAERFSAGPSRRSGGDVGFFPRHDRMVEAFAKAAFSLAKDENSPPVVTPFGVHLIRCTDIRPGSKSWIDVRSDLAAADAQELFHKLAGEMRTSVKIEYNPAVPHLDRKGKE